MALEDHELPEDVKIGHMTFRKGVSLAVLVGAARRWHERAHAQEQVPPKGCLCVARGTSALCPVHHPFPIQPQT